MNECVNTADVNNEFKKEKQGKKEKKERKEKKDTDAENGNTEDDTKKSKKRKAQNDDDDDEIEETEKPKKQKKSKENQSASKTADDDSDGKFYPVRPRTRSLSDAEEHNKLIPSLNGEDFRKAHTITVTGVDEKGAGQYQCPDPMASFADTPFAAPLRRALDSAGFTHPTPTQAQSWPIALGGRDIITVARTGSGKTCGFLLPAFHQLLSKFQQRRRGPPGILVLAPTRELACQIEEEAIKFGRSSGIRSMCAYGGSPKGFQLRKIEQGVEIIIATPGRLNDFLEMGKVNLSQILFLVLDEADRM